MTNIKWKMENGKCLLIEQTWQDEHHHQSLPTNCVRSSRSRIVALRSSISFMVTSLSDWTIFSCITEIRIWSCMMQESADASFCSSGVSGELMFSNSS